MLVPITSDLHGYQAFWLALVTRGLVVLVMIVTVFLIVLRFWIVPAIGRAVAAAMQHG